MKALLQPQHAFSAGSELWSVPLNIPKPTLLRLDWYLNFQVSKALRLQSRNRSESLNQLLEELRWELPTHSLPASEPILISARHLVPCRWVSLHSPALEKDTAPEKSTEKWTEQWLDQVQRNWQSLGKPHLRLFTPEGEDPAKIQKLWAPRDPVENFSIITNSESFVRRDGE